jgi:hypothetical protein
MLASSLRQYLSSSYLGLNRVRQEKLRRKKASWFSKRLSANARAPFPFLVTLFPPSVHGGRASREA